MSKQMLIKRLKTLGVVISLSTLLVGCEEEKEKTSLYEYEQSLDYFDLSQDSSKVIIKIEEKNGKESIHFADRITLYKCQFFNDYEKYESFYQGDISNDRTYLYFDMDGNLLCVKYAMKLNISQEKVIDYRVSELLEEEQAYDYAISYIGMKDNYTREEINEMVEKIREDQKKIKSLVSK